MVTNLSCRIWTSAGFSHVGHVRERNEDAWLGRTDNGLWAVADGMGGHDEGQYASQAIVDALSKEFRADSLEFYLEQVRARLFDVNRHLHARAQALGADRCIGSTVAALLAVDDRCACIWAGDSRLYLWRRQNLFQVSRDHSMEQQWLDEGQQAADIARHPQRHALTRAIGVGPSLQLEVRTFRVLPGDLLLLCSDGIYRELDPEELSILMGLVEPSEIIRSMQTHILRRQAKDNMTAVVIRVD